MVWREVEDGEMRVRLVDNRLPESTITQKSHNHWKCKALPEPQGP